MKGQIQGGYTTSIGNPNPKTATVTLKAPTLVLKMNSLLKKTISVQIMIVLS